MMYFTGMHKHRMSPAKAELELCMLLLLPGGEGQGEEKGDLGGGGVERGAHEQSDGNVPAVSQNEA